jgi:transposase-like protein
VEAEQIAAVACLPQPGHQNTVLGDPDKVQLLLASLRDGNYREIACRQAGISKQTFYNWLKRAEAGESGPIALVDAVEKAEADAEVETVRNVRNASKLPQFWAAGMTYLERKSPDRWGRRNEDSGSPRVVVQIGVKDGDVQVQIGSSESGAAHNPLALQPE